MKIWVVILYAVALLLFSSFAAAAQKNGFVLDGASIPIKEIRRGGPPRDGIPAIDHPRFVPVSGVNFLSADDRVLGYASSMGARAYPVRILNWHEVVNDHVASRGLLITYCPLCGTGMAFELDKKETFGVSGLLYNSDVLLYDRKSNSLWSQILGQAVSGSKQGERLQQIPLRHTTWDKWRNLHPDTLTLAPPVGSRVDYRKNPYEGYERTRKLYFPVKRKSRAYHPKERVLGLVIDGEARAYPFSELDAAGETIIEKIGNQTVRVWYDAEADSAWIEKAVAGSKQEFEELPSVIGFWFAWYAFHPNTTVFEFERYRKNGCSVDPRKSAAVAVPIERNFPC